MFLNWLLLVRNDIKFLESFFIYLANGKDKVAEKVSWIQILILQHIFSLFTLPMSHKINRDYSLVSTILSLVIQGHRIYVDIM